MRTFEIQSQSGEKYTINAPEGATEKQAFEYFKTTPEYKKAKTPETSTSEAFGRSMAEGATVGYYPRIRGLVEAGGAKPEEPASLGSLATGAYRYFTGDKEAETAYETAKKRESERYKKAKEEHPYATTGGEILGSVPTMLALPELAALKGAGLAGRLAQGAITGGVLGGVAGSAEEGSAKDRALQAALGLTTGAVGGVAAPLLGAGVEKLYDRFGKPVVATIRGWKDPEAEAARRIASAIYQDQQDIVAGKSKGMTLADWQKARSRGEPVTLADLGAGNTQAFLRSAANTTPEGRALIEKVVYDRFHDQSERVASDVRRLVSKGANASATRDQLIENYEKARGPAYKKAFDRPAAESMWDGSLEQISQAPTVQQAMRAAMVTAKDEAAKIPGVTPPKMPFITDQNGRLILDPTKSLRPNLQYWDAVKKNLDKIGGREAEFWAKTLRNHLDGIVPEYAQARGTAATFFGARDALEAGRLAVGKRMEPADLSKLLNKMDPTEAELFREGWASEWSKQILDSKESADVSGKLFNSKNDRSRAEIVFGRNGAAKIEARVELERIMDGARKALGNSTTARQLIEAGLAGGAIGGYFGDWKPEAIFGGAGVGASIRGGAKAELFSGAQRVIGYVDKNTAKKVAELLMSNNEQDLNAGLRMVADNEKIAAALRNVADKVSLAASAQLNKQMVNQNAN